MKNKEKKIKIRKDLMLEIGTDGFVLWKMVKTGKKWEKDKWIIDASLINLGDTFQVCGNILTENPEFKVD